MRMSAPACSRVALLLWTISGHAADLYRIAGSVVNVQTGAALANARVTIFPSASTVPLATVTTGSNGHFDLDLPEGKYNLRAGTRDGTQVYGLKSPDSAAGIAIVAGPGQATGNLLFRWFPEACISGKVLDESGEPAEGVLVQLLRSRSIAGVHAITTSAWRRTDDLGEYRFATPAGTYYLTVTGEPWYSAGDGLFVETAHSAAYTTEYYQGAHEPGGATPIKAAPGEEIRADFNLRTAPGATVSVKYEGPAAAPAMLSFIVDGIGATESYVRQQRLYGASGVQRIVGIPPGRYLVRAAASAGASNFAAERTVDVSGNGAAIELTLQPAPSVSGVVRLKNATAKPRGTLLVSLTQPGDGRNFSTAVKPDGSFQFPNMANTSYRVAIRGSDGYFASEIRATGKTEMSAGVLKLAGGETATLDIVASDEIGNVAGFVRDGDRPIAGSLVVLAPAAEPSLPTRGFLTDSDGSFDIEHVPSGRYLLFATESVELEYMNSGAVRPYLPGAKAVRVEPHGKVAETIGISRPGLEK